MIIGACRAGIAVRCAAVTGLHGAPLCRVWRAVVRFCRPIGGRAVVQQWWLLLPLAAAADGRTPRTPTTTLDPPQGRGRGTPTQARALVPVPCIPCTHPMSMRACMRYACLPCLTRPPCRTRCSSAWRRRRRSQVGRVVVVVEEGALQAGGKPHWIMNTVSCVFGKGCSAGVALAPPWLGTL